MKTVIIVGSSSASGNTVQLSQAVARQADATLINLQYYKIAQFDYAFNNQQDDFIALMKRILTFDNIVLASPVYWYAASGIMKCFMDRFSDLLKTQKPLGRQLRGKNAALIATGSDLQPAPCFEQMFALTYEYLGMDYRGMLYQPCPDDIDLRQSRDHINSFIEAALC